MENKLEPPKHYQLNVTILECRHLEIVNVNTTVIVSIGNQKKTVRAKTHKTEHPYFNELFRFPFYEPLQTFLKHRLRLCVQQTTCCKLIGLCDIELSTVWAQLGHQFYHKWAILSHPKDPLSGLKGYLKCDLQILAEGLSPLPPIGEHGQEIEGNLLVPFEGHHRRQNALFIFSIFRADGIIYKKEKCGKEVIVPCKNLYVKVTFAGKTVKTKVAKKTSAPVWNEALNFKEAVPSLFQTISIELWDKKKDVMVGSTSLSMNKLWSHQIGVLPTFGPSFVYIYRSNKKKPTLLSMTGRIFLSLTCQLIDREDTTKLLKTIRIPPFPENSLPPYEPFTLFFAVFHCLLFKKKYFKKCAMMLNHGSKFLLNADNNMAIAETRDNLFVRFDNPKRVCKPYYSWSSKKSVLTAQTTAFWPTTNSREWQNNRIKHLMRDVSEQINQCQRMYYLGNYTAADAMSKKVWHQLVKTCDKMMSFPPLNFQTDLDVARKVEFRELLRKIKLEIENTLEKKLSFSFDFLEKAHQSVNSILERTEDPQRTFPDFEIALIKMPKNMKKTQILLKSEDYLFSPVTEERGWHCGKVETLFMRNEIGDEVGAIDAFIWFGKSSCLQGYLQVLLGNDKKNEEDTLGTINMEERHQFELRVHVYQGRLNPGSDASGLADPFVRVLAFEECRETHVKYQTLDPFWDETLLFSRVHLLGMRQFIKTQSTGVVFEVLDYDGKNSVELVGRGVVRPQVHLLNDRYIPPKLKREKVFSYGEVTAEVLLAMELIEVSAHEEPRPLKPPSQYKMFGIPEEIRPHFKRCLLEVLFWGIRNYENNCLPPNPKVMALIGCGGVRFESSLAKARDALNFEFQVHKSEIFVPTEEDYSPPISANLYVFNCFDKASYKGGVMLPYVTLFSIKSEKREANTEKIKNQLNFQIHLNLIGQGDSSNHIVELDEAPDWWTKYYASKVSQRHMKALKIYGEELEKQPEFQGFHDFLFSFDIKKGKTDLRQSMSNQKSVATLKCSIRLHSYPKNESDVFWMPDQLSSCPRPDDLQVTVRVYIVAAHNLTPTDVNGRCDPYIALTLGKIKIIDRKNYVYKETNPIFGKCYELKGTFPWDHTLRIRVMDHDICQSDDLIGQTFIDLENRYYTKHRASCGISDTYETSGYCQWRDLVEPYEILQHVCKQNKIPDPHYSQESIRIGCYAIPCYAEGKEKTALNILRNFHDVPDFGYHIVPEHVETRSLFHPKKPDIEQGKLEMWVDIFPGHSSLPPAVNISPRAPQTFELRIIVWNTADVLHSDVSLITRQRSSDIFVKAWLTSPKQSQTTDVHYRSLTGEGNFNWRFIFPFVYSPAEHKMILKKKVTFSDGLWMEKVPCTLEVQVWDNDLLLDDFIGSLSLNLWDMAKGANSAKECSLKILDPNFPRVSVFKLKKTRGWWPFSAKGNKKTKEKVLAGKIDMELEVLTEEEAKSNPAGLGRNGPQPLPEPKRPATSFFWAFNPLTLLKNLTFGGFGRKLVILAAIAAVILFCIAAWLALPGLLLKKFLKA